MKGNRLTDNPLLQYNKKNQKEIEFNMDWISECIPLFNFVNYDNVNLSFDIHDLLGGLEMAKKWATNNAEEEEKSEISEKHFVNEILFNKIETLLEKLNIESNNINVGTLSWSLVIISRHFIDCEQILEDNDYEEKKSNCKRTLSFLTFLEAYMKGDIGISRITISPETNKNVKGTFEFPSEWFDLFFISFQRRLELNTLISAEEFITQRKKECEDYLRAFPRRKIMYNKVIRENVVGLDKLLEEKLLIKVPNKRHVIIGRLLSYIGMPYSIDEIELRCRDNSSENEFVADLAREYLRQAKK
jgi:hypothetical protein